MSRTCVPLGYNLMGWPEFGVSPTIPCTSVNGSTWPRQLTDHVQAKKNSEEQTLAFERHSTVTDGAGISHQVAGEPNVSS